MSDEKKPGPNDPKDNLIPFPTDRVKKKREVKALAGKLPSRKATLFLSIGVLIIGASLINNYVFQHSRLVATNDRGFIVDTEAEKQLAAELSNPDNRGPASFGREPSAEDNLRSADLHSRYQLVHENGMVVSIQLMPGPGVTLEPIYIKDRMEFLKSYRKVIAPGYDNVEPIPDPENSNLAEESYLLKRGPASVGIAKFELDRSGAFHSLKVEVSEK